MLQQFQQQTFRLFCLCGAGATAGEKLAGGGITKPIPGKSRVRMQRKQNGCPLRSQTALVVNRHSGFGVILGAPHQHNGAARLFCQLPQPLEDGPHLIGPVHIHTFPKVRLDGIEDQQSSIRFLDRLSDSVVAQRQFPLALVDNQHTGAVRTQRCEP